LIIYR
jgi:hypothetical protein